MHFFTFSRVCKKFRSLSYIDKFNYLSVFILFFSVPLFYVYEFVSPIKSFLFFKIIHFYDLRHLIYTLTTIIFSILFLSLWFFRCKHAWNLFILFPLSMYLAQFFYYFSTATLIINGGDLIYQLYFLPFAIVFCFVLCKIKQKLLKLELSDQSSSYTIKSMYEKLHFSTKNESFSIINWEKEQIRANLIEEKNDFSLMPLTTYGIPFLLILSIPLSYTFLFFSKEKGFYDLNLFHSIDNFQYFIFYTMNKFIKIMLLSIWFFSSKGWWRFFILWPLLMYLFQLVSWISFEVGFISQNNWYFGLVVLFVLFPLYKYRDLISLESTYKNWIKKKKGFSYSSKLKKHKFLKRNFYTYQLFWLILIGSFFIHNFFSPSAAINCFLRILYDSKEDILYPELFFLGKLLLVILFFVLFCRSDGFERLLFIIPFSFYSMHLIKLLIEEDRNSVKSFNQNEIWYLLPIGFIGLVYFYKNRKYIFMKNFSENLQKEFYLKEIERLKLLRGKSKSF